ncbi:GGDEF domain-containing protein [Subtercola sp. YIM 133946]|uniref:GGDEF domain-containing protein n=1 Tax=Subtercola sp. YIM 133946 TaxID=3118909 RepID=UPI002F9536CE
MTAPTAAPPADVSQLLFRSRVVQILAVETAVLYAFLALFVDIHPFWVRLVLGFLATSAAVVALAVRGRAIATHAPGRILIIAAMVCLSFVAYTVTNPGLPVIIVYSLVSLTMAATVLDTYRMGLLIGSIGVVLAIVTIVLRSANPLAACVVYLGLTVTSTFLLVRQRQFLELARDAALNLALTDSLTGLLNRRGMEVQVPLLDSVSRRTGQQLACILLDLDHFKAINDRFGHAVGDEVLRVTAATIVRTMREADVAVRTGGEEFAIFCLVLGEQDMMALAERLRHELEQQPSAPQLTVSIGAAIGSGGDTVQISALSARADKALYAAKQGGRNTIRSA